MRAYKLSGNILVPLDKSDIERVIVIKKADNYITENSDRALRVADNVGVPWDDFVKAMNPKIKEELEEEYDIEDHAEFLFRYMDETDEDLVVE